MGAMAARHHDSLPNLYDWTWFARQMNYAGIENQLGGYVPQSPATMLPMMPIAGFPPLTAKRIWLVLNLILLLAVIGMLARMTGVRWEYLTILLLCGYRSLMTNFIYGQYYIFLLFLLTLTLCTFARNRDSLSGFLCGATFAMKLYPGPLLIYFAAKRAWTSVLGMLAGAACVGGVALLLFGWSGIAYYLTHVLPRTLEGNSVDPYNLLTATPNMLLHRVFLREAELNPHPVFEAPWLFFFMRTATQLGLVVFAALGVVMEGRPGSPPRSCLDPDSAGADLHQHRDPHVHSVVGSDGGAVAGRLAPQNVVPVCLLFDAESLSSAGAFP